MSSAPRPAIDPRVVAPSVVVALKPAGFWARYMAWSLDAVLIAILTCVIGASHWRFKIAAAREAYAVLNKRMADVMSGSVLNDMDFGGFAQQLMTDPVVHAASTAVVDATTSLIFGWIFLFALFGLLYEVGFVAFSSWQATPGKRALGLRVTALDGGKLGLGPAVVRYLAGSLSWLTLNIGHVMAMAKPEHRALHDRIASARVLRTGAAATPLWGWAWLLLQTFATLAACVWLMRMMQTAMDAALAI